MDAERSLKGRKYGSTVFRPTNLPFQNAFGRNFGQNAALKERCDI